MKRMDEWMQGIMSQGVRKVIPIMTHPGIEMCGRTVKEAVTDGFIHTDAIVKLNAAFPADAVTSIMDLTVEAEAFGAEVLFSDHEAPSVVGRLVHDREAVDSLALPPISAARVPEYLQAFSLSAKAIIDKPVFAGCIGPFSLAGRLFDLSELMVALCVDPETITALLEKCTRFLLNYCLAIKESGADGVILAEPAAGLISNEDCVRYSSHYVKQIVDAVQDDTFIVILHNCGNTGHCTDAMIRSGAKGLHFGNKANMVDALKACPADLLVMGNLDPVVLFKQSSAEEVRRATEELLESTASWNNFIISTGCDVPPHIPTDNISAFYDAVRAYNHSRGKGA